MLRVQRTSRAGGGADPSARGAGLCARLCLCRIPVGLWTGAGNAARTDGMGDRRLLVPGGALAAGRGADAGTGALSLCVSLGPRALFERVRNGIGSGPPARPRTVERVL